MHILYSIFSTSQTVTDLKWPNVKYHPSSSCRNKHNKWNVAAYSFPTPWAWLHPRVQYRSIYLKTTMCSSFAWLHQMSAGRGSYLVDQSRHEQFCASFPNQGWFHSAIKTQWATRGLTYVNFKKILDLSFKKFDY